MDNIYWMFITKGKYVILMGIVKIYIVLTVLLYKNFYLFSLKKLFYIYNIIRKKKK
jgi:hypothetical protein